MTVKMKVTVMYDIECEECGEVASRITGKQFSNKQEAEMWARENAWRTRHQNTVCGTCFRVYDLGRKLRSKFHSEFDVSFDRQKNVFVIKSSKCIQAEAIYRVCRLYGITQKWAAIQFEPNALIVELESKLHTRFRSEFSIFYNDERDVYIIESRKYTRPQMVHDVCKLYGLNDTQIEILLRKELQEVI